MDFFTWDRADRLDALELCLRLWCCWWPTVEDEAAAAILRRDDDERDVARWWCCRCPPPPCAKLFLEAKEMASSRSLSSPRLWKRNKTKSLKKCIFDNPFSGFICGRKWQHSPLPSMAASTGEREEWIFSFSPSPLRPPAVASFLRTRTLASSSCEIQCSQWWEKILLLSAFSYVHSRPRPCSCKLRSSRYYCEYQTCTYIFSLSLLH